MSKRKNLLIIALAVVIIVVAVGIGMGIYMNRPEMVMKTSVQSLLTDVFEREEFGVVSNLFEGGSAEIIMSLSGGDNEVSLEYKEYFVSKKNETYIEKLKFSANDFSIDGSFYSGEDYMYVSVPDIYGDAVGISRGGSEQAFDSSIFAYYSGSDFELDEEISDSIKILCRIYDDAQDKKFVEEIDEVLDSYGKLIMDLIGEYADIEKENDTVKINGDQVNARVITVEIDAECIYNVMADLHKELEKDKKIPKLIEKYGDLIDEYVEDTCFEGMLQEELGEDADEKLVDVILDAYETMVESFGDIVDEFEDSIDEADDTKIILELTTKRASSDLMALKVSSEIGKYETEIIDIQIGKEGIKKTDDVKIEIAETMIVEFKVKQNDRKGYKSEFVIKDGDTELAKLYAKIDKSGEEFEFGFKFGDESYAIEGDYTKSGKKHTLDFKDVVYTDAWGDKVSLINDLLGEAETLDIDFELKLIICENDKPKPVAKGKVKSVFELDEDDFEDMQIAIEELIAEAQDAFEITGVEGVPAVDYDGDGYESGFGW